MKALLFILLLINNYEFAQAQILIEDPRQDQIVVETTTSPVFTTIRPKLSKYKNNYILFGDPNTKVQLSFQSMLFQTPLQQFFFGYSQLMYWELFKSSSPFTEVNYQPAFYSRFKLSNNFVNFVDLGFFEHNSNGKDQINSRSSDSGYINFNIPLSIGSWDLDWENKIFIYYNLGPHNEDLKKYTGNFKSSFNLKKVNSGFFKEVQIKLSLMARSQQLDIDTQLGTNFYTPKIYIQLYNGYAESLLNYDQEDSIIRVGFKL